ncbi:MAG: hypothetical protein KIT27_02445 [Legionellales bacterium]|nr:hypothetical protein [Legionellales bacterium]
MINSDINSKNTTPTTNITSSTVVNTIEKTLEAIHQNEHEKINLLPTPKSRPKMKRKHWIKLGLQALMLAATVVSLAIPIVNLVIALGAVVTAISVGLLGWKNRHINWRWFTNPFSQPFYQPNLAPKSSSRRALKNGLIVLGLALAVVTLAVVPPVLPLAAAATFAAVGIFIILGTLIDYAHKFLFHGERASDSASQQLKHEENQHGLKPEISPHPEESEAKILESLAEQSPEKVSLHDIKHQSINTDILAVEEDIPPLTPSKLMIQSTPSNNKKEEEDDERGSSNADQEFDEPKTL